MKIKERYLWALFVAAVLIAAAYFRFYYQPGLYMKVVMYKQSAVIFPYQSVSVPINITNTGSAEIDNMSFGLYLNGNSTQIYKVILPAGRSVTVFYNFTPAHSGIYNISFMADPNNFYNIQDRQEAHSYVDLAVSNSIPAKPYEYFSDNGLIGENNASMTPFGYEVALALYENRTEGITSASTVSTGLLAPSSSALLNSEIIYPAMYVYSKYIGDVAVASGYYKNYTLVSMWIKGLLTPSAIQDIAVGKGLNTTIRNNVSIIKLGGNATLCSFYAGGWLQNLALIPNNPNEKSGSCYSALSVDNGSFKNNSPYYMLKTSNYSIFDYSGSFGNLSYAGSLAGINGTIYYESILRGPNLSNECTGQIFNISNSSYCSSRYIEPGNTLLTESGRLVGNYSLNVWTLSNITDFARSYNQGLGLLGSYNAIGNRIRFVSVYANSCSLEGNLTCFNESFNYNKLSLMVHNGNVAPVTLTGIQCYNSGSAVEKTLGITLHEGENASISTECYSNGTVISGYPIGLGLILRLNYTEYGRPMSALGYTYIP
jgi:hypothetical protein